MNSLSSTKKGLIITGIIILSSFVSFYLFHLPTEGLSQYLSFSFFILGLLWVLFSAKKKMKEISIKNYFSEGFKAFIVVAFFMAIYVFVFYRLNPQILESKIAENNELIKLSKDKTALEIEQNARQLRNVFMPMMITITVVMYLFMGALVSLVTGGFLHHFNKK